MGASNKPFNPKVSHTPLLHRLHRLRHKSLPPRTLVQAVLDLDHLLERREVRRAVRRGGDGGRDARRKGVPDCEVADPGEVGEVEGWREWGGGPGGRRCGGRDGGGEEREAEVAEAAGVPGGRDLSSEDGLDLGVSVRSGGEVGACVELG